MTPLFKPSALHWPARAQAGVPAAVLACMLSWGQAGPAAAADVPATATASASAAAPATATASAPGWPVAAAAGCWQGPPAAGGLAARLAQCQRLGVDLVRLRLSTAAHPPGTLQACAPDGAQDGAPDAAPNAVPNAARNAVPNATPTAAPNSAPNSAPVSAPTSAPTSADCLPLTALLQLPALQASTTRLLLEAPAAVMDALQSQLDRSGLQGRVWVAPLVQRPSGPLALEPAPGVHYRRTQRLQPRPVVLHVLHIEAGRARVSYVGTPQAPGTWAAGDGYAAQRTSDFLQQHGLLAAVNGTYFLPFKPGRLLHEASVPASGQIAQIATAQPASAAADAPVLSDEPRVNGTVCAGGATLLPTRLRCPAGTAPLLAAGPMLLEAGQRSPLQARSAAEQPDASGMARYYREANPRTAVAVNRHTGDVWWVVVDGRQSGYSDGMSLPELSTELLALGATDAINLDGGGSSTLALSLGGQPQVMNSPVHTALPGRERPVANHLGLRLLPEAAPRR